MKFEERFVVQDLETFEFLFPDFDGSIGQTPYISLAGKYDSREDAFEAGLEEIGSAFKVFGFYEKLEDDI